MLSVCGLSDTIVDKIWRLNSQKHGFFSQKSVRAKYTPFWGVFCARTGLGEKFEILVVEPPYFAGRLVFWYAIGGHITCWCVIT